jgi:CheY-like chemotaxis protein
VLVVDDYPSAANTLAMLVKLWGYDVQQAYDGATGLALARDYRPDVLLLDIVMPTVSGLEVASQMRQQAGLKDCLLIAVTGRGDATTRRQCEEVGFDVILLKPINFANLQTLLALESEYRSRLPRHVQIAARSPATVVLRKGMNSPWRCSQLRDRSRAAISS